MVGLHLHLQLIGVQLVCILVEHQVWVVGCGEAAGGRWEGGGKEVWEVGMWRRRDWGEGVWAGGTQGGGSVGGGENNNK